jgi:IPT/TIG domain/PASTA domain
MLAALFWAGSCQAKMVTVGATLPMPLEHGFIFGCESSCVLMNIGPADGASDVSPVEGVILRWHLYAAGGASGIAPGYHGHFRLRVLSPQGQEYVGAGRSVPVATNEWESVETFPTDLPIRAGQLIGLELEDEASDVQWGLSPGAQPLIMEPAIADGEAGSAASLRFDSEAVWPFNAEILPAPLIAGVSSSRGPSAGGNQVDITGENFAEVTSVSFGSTGASYAVASETELTATVPAGSPSSVPVSVVTAAGRAEAPTGYAYESSQTATASPAPGCLVPRLKGRRLEAVRQMLSRDRCRLGRVRKRHQATVRAGRVKKQSPSPGAALPSGGRVEVTLGLAH